MNKNVLSIVVILIVIGAGYFLIQKLNEPKAEEGAKQNIYVDSSTTITNNAPQKSETEVYVEGGIEGVKLLKGGLDKLHDENRRNDSIHLANRQPIWVYQIGGFKSDPKDFKEVYERLVGEGISNIYIIKKSRKTFYLIQNDGRSSQEELETNRKETEELWEEKGINQQLLTIDLHSYCGQEDAVPDGDVKVDRKVRVACYSCR